MYKKCTALILEGFTGNYNMRILQKIHGKTDLKNNYFGVRHFENHA